MRGNMRNASKSALLVSDSHLWGIWTFKALKKAEISVEPLLYSDINERFLEEYRALFVPGGWSRNKLGGLSEEQRGILREFVKRGGLYVGICGGASLAGIEGLGIASIKRTSERVPSYSGPCRVKFEKGHPLFQGVKPYFFLWFPPEFELLDSHIQILASFEAPEKGAYVADLAFEDFKDYLDFFEEKYGIPLNPSRMMGKPLVLEESYGSGKVILSLIHFDTPNCPNGLKFLKNLAEHYKLPKSSKPLRIISRKTYLQRSFKMKLEKCYKEALSLLDFGIRNFFFHKRYPYFYQWRRGIRGLELLNLIYLFEEMVNLLHHVELRKETLDFLSETCEGAEELIHKVLYALKLDYMKERGIKVKEEEVIREVFGENKKSYGGEYKRLINLLEEVIVKLWREAYR